MGGVKNRIAERSEFLRCKNKGPARRISCKPLICLVPEAGIEPARPYERGILSLMSGIAIQYCLMKLCFLSDFFQPPPVRLLVLLKATRCC